MGYLLINGDSRRLPIDLSGVDAVIMDPPYGISHKTNYGASWEDTHIANDHDTSARDLIIGLAERVGIPWACFGTWKRPKPLGTRATLVWDKGPAFGMGDLSFPWKSSWEEIYIGGPGWSGRRDEGVLRGHFVVSWESKGRVHPHEKPTSLVMCILRKLPGIRRVLDPFMGSGPVAMACQELGLDFVGIEIDPHYCEIARRRIERPHARVIRSHQAESSLLPLFAGLKGDNL